MKVVYRLSLLLLALLSPILWAKPVLVDQAIAIVNNEIITQTDYDQLKATVERNAREDNRQLPPAKALRRQLMDKLIDDQLILQQAKRMGIEISDAQLDQTIENIIQQSGKSRQQFIKDLKSQQNLSYKEFQRQIRQQLLISQTSQSAVRRQISIDKQAVKSMVKLLDQQGEKRIRYHIEHIMVKFSDSASPQAAQKQAQHIMAQLKAGANFTKLALSESQGPKALKGGDWGWMGINEMPTIFAQVIHQQPAGTLIGPFKSDAGYHILKIAGVKGIDKVEATEVKVRHILIKPSIIMSDAKARELLSQIRKDILSGKGTFAQYARKYSQDTGSAVKGGELGWTDPSSFVPAFRKMVETLPIGKISQPFHSQFGWHIVEVEARRKTDKTAESKQQQAFQILYRRQYQEQMQNWLDDLHRHAYIKKLNVSIH
ncbi:periplasmic chaperone for outer membrane proteins SurA [Celerinatantimonas diazotrophica]|uniref:Chaperone SurA n=1 Tax=Celerinatantimonas diazotrophica TaxID=412034 RepID=A0A4V2PSN9_9GAMM|nr:periplasmic chaperone for outer membrane proteins SurA [Celerinatantimonas diazotrophica]CAG9295630.1 Chaperone SurA [Celerinatantimonas diazotrophica]